MIVKRSYVEGPRWVAFGTALKRLACDIGLEIRIEERKGILRETVFFELRGTDNQVQHFLRAVERGVKEWNSR